MVKVRPEAAGEIELSCGLVLSSDDGWEFVNYLDENDLLDSLFVMVPTHDWGDGCPECEIGFIDEFEAHCAAYLACANCGFLPAWRYGSYKWQHGRPKEISKMFAQESFMEGEDF